jgi:hypothetical protein
VSHLSTPSLSHTSCCPRCKAQEGSFTTHANFSEQAAAAGTDEASIREKAKELVQRRSQQASATAAKGAAGVAKASANVVKASAKWKQAASLAASKHASKLRKRGMSFQERGGGSGDAEEETAGTGAGVEETQAQAEARCEMETGS